jgi:hypothetical protein
MSVSLLTFRSGVRKTLESTTLSDAQLNQWIGEAIGELQGALPPSKRGEIYITTAGQQTFSLAADFADLIALREVEYPGGQAPLRIITRLDRYHARFAGGPYYDVLDITTGPVLYLGESPAAGETILLHYTYRYPIPEDDADLIIVPEEQWPILHLYVQWKAYLHASWEIMVQATPDPDTGEQLRLSALRVEEMFWRRIEEARRNLPTSAIQAWHIPGLEQIY